MVTDFYSVAIAGHRCTADAACSDGGGVHIIHFALGMWPLSAAGDGGQGILRAMYADGIGWQAAMNGQSTPSRRSSTICQSHDVPEKPGRPQRGEAA
jgi:hypothetical protein